MSPRIRFVILLSLLALAVVGPAAAQTLTIGGAPSASGTANLPVALAAAGAAPVKDATDFASTVIGDPWDFEQQSDFVYMYSSGWNGVPAVASGVLTGSVAADPFLDLQFEGILGALNVVGRNGVVFPIDTTRYKRIAFRMRRSRAPANGDTLEAQWFHDPCRAGCSYGGKLFYDVTYDTSLQRYIDQSPRASQNDTAGAKDTSRFHIYKLDLDTLPPRSYGAAWDARAIARGLTLRLGEGGGAPGTLGGATIEVDWVRLVPRGETTARLAWNNLGGAVTLTATHAETGDVVQIFPDDGTPATTFADNSAYVWDYGHLPPGTWTVTARGRVSSQPAVIYIDPAPVLQILDPDAAGGADFASTVIGDPWDMRNREDVWRWGKTYNVASEQYGSTGMTGVNTNGDPVVALVDDSPRGASGLVVDASRYHRLTFTVDLDHKELDPQSALSATWGSVARVIWREAGANGGPLTQTQDIVVLDQGPNTYTMDLATLDATHAGCETAPDCELEPGYVHLWTGGMGVLRIDPHEGQNPRTFRLADVKLAADDETNPNGFFTVRWAVSDATFSRAVAGGAGGDATVSLYWDSDTTRTNGRTLIASGLPASAGQYLWDTSALARSQRVYVSMDITDAAGNTQTRYSSGPVAIPAYATAVTDNNGNGLGDAWEQKYGVSSPSADEDHDGVNNLAEYQGGTNPRLPNVWNLPEGSTGFFTERLALANPDDVPAQVMVTYLRDSGGPVTKAYTVNPWSRLTIDVNSEGLGNVAVSAVIRATSGGVVVERTVMWGEGAYGGHTGKAIDAPATDWFLAEGSQGFFDTFILLSNATGSPATVTIDYLVENGTPLSETYTVAPNARRTIYANDVLNPVPGTGDPVAHPGPLANRNFSSRIHSTVPIAVERSMYFSNGGRAWNGGHEAAAVTSAATTWFVAEGRTGPDFDEYLLIANPGASPANVTITYLKPNGVVTQQLVGPNAIPGASRRTIWVDAVPGIEDAEVSASITSDVPVIVERSMYWPDLSRGWIEAHASAGVTATGTQWALAEGEKGGPLNVETYVLVANPGSADAHVTLRALRTAGPPIDLTLTIPARSRATRSSFDFPGLNWGEQFGVLVTSADAPIVVEHAMYWDGGGQHWGGGSGETGVRLR